MLFEHGRDGPLAQGEAASLDTRLAELLESARAIESTLEKKTGSAGADLVEKVRLFEVDCSRQFDVCYVTDYRPRRTSD